MISRRQKHLFCFGYGASARALSARLAPWGEWEITGSSRDGRKIDRLETILFDGDRPMADARAHLSKASHVLLSIPPDGKGDPVVRHHARDIAACAGTLQWLGYLSSTSVYGDHGGAWVDESTPCNPVSERGRRRLLAEERWLSLGAELEIPVHIFRLAGIYGPGRNPLQRLRHGRARRIGKPGHVFSRIHLADITNVLEVSMYHPRGGAVYNVCDDEPAPPGDVIACAAALLGMDAPPETPLEEADLSDMQRSFYSENKRVCNQLIKRELKIRLAYPGYREGLRGCLALGE